MSKYAKGGIKNLQEQIKEMITAFMGGELGGYTHDDLCKQVFINHTTDEVILVRNGEVICLLAYYLDGNLEYEF